MKLDQYGDKIPNDLVFLLSDVVADISREKFDQILLMPWYTFERNLIPQIFVSSQALREIAGAFDFVSIQDAYNVVARNIVKIDTVLHRYNDRDGFYWA